MAEFSLTPSTEVIEEKRQPRRPSIFLWSILVAVAFMLGLFAGYMIWERPDQTAQVPQQVKRYDVSIDDDPIYGNEKAKITIIEFSDYQCPFCERWHQEVWPQIKNAYGNKIRLVYRDFPLYGLHPEAEPAAEAANCAGEQKRYFDFHDLLLSGQKELGADTYLAYAQSLNLNTDNFKKCLDDHRYQKEVKADYDFASELGVRSTPTFFVNGLAVVGAQPFDVFKQLIDLELAGKIPKK
jgi:protein-disulfide isomerase